MSSDLRTRPAPRADERPALSLAQRARPDDRPAPRRDLAVTIGLFAALVAALLPVLPVVKPGAWMLGAVALAALILAAGALARRRRIPAVGVSLIEAAAWVLFMTGVFLPETALLWIIPTLDTFGAVPPLVDQAVIEIANGSAPLDASPALSVMIVGAMGLLALIVDHVVLTARLPLLASVGILAVSLIPSIAVPGDLDVMAFVLLAASILFLIRAETGSRVTAPVRAAERTAGIPATAVGIAAVAVIVTLVATPLLPAPIPRTGTGVGSGPGIDASLQLGDDLRRPIEVEVLRVRTSGTEAPYLRATTLSRFDGAIWLPDRVRTVPLASEEGLGELEAGEDIRQVEATTSVDIVNLASIWAPIPYPAVSVTGLEGGWAAVPYNRTVVSQAGTAQGQDYEVLSATPRPTLEQIRASEADSATLREELTALPDDLPPIIAETAAQVTAGTTTDYDALIALQRWFRGSEFRYSLSAPVADGFDGTGADAVADFLEVKAGYCIHFASAFALMARTLDMPTRIVVGYLPGVPTTERIDDEVVYSVPSSLLHAWPEVHFEGIGWVGFEPTNSLGNPTSFLPASVAPGQVGDPGDTEPRPTATPSTNPSANPLDLDDPRAGETAGEAVRTVNPLPTLSALFAILLLLAVPAIVRDVRRRQLAAAAEAGDSAAAWITVQDAAIDVGIPVPASESPRAFAARLVAEHGAPSRELGVLATAIERASYASSAVAGYWHGNDVADAAASVRAALLRGASPARRVLAVIAPRSLVIRPGSIYAAGAEARVRAR